MMMYMCQDNKTEPMRDDRISQDPRERAFQKANDLARDLAPKNRAARQEAAEQEYANAYGEASTLDRPARPSLQERVAKQWHHARDEARNCERLNELQGLLAKNPDVARILDLMEIVRG